MQIKFYWHRATFIYLHLVCAAFALKQQSGVVRTDSRAREASFFLISGLLQEKFANPWYLKHLKFYSWAKTNDCRIQSVYQIIYVLKAHTTCSDIFSMSTGNNIGKQSRRISTKLHSPLRSFLGASRPQGLGVGQRGHWLYSYFLWNFILFVLRRQIHITWVIRLFKINFLKARLVEAEIGINGIKNCELWPWSVLSTSRIFSVLMLHPPFSFFQTFLPAFLLPILFINCRTGVFKF